MNLPPEISHILKLYTIDVIPRYNYKRESSNNHAKLIVKVWINFTPKKVTTLTPDVSQSYGKWEYRWNGEKYESSFEDMTYIRKDEMPILSYIQAEYELDNFCEEIVLEKFREIKEKYF